MKIGLRKPNIKSRIKARTTGKLKRKVKKSVNPFYGKKGMGMIKNPKKAVYNKVYNKTSVGIGTGKKHARATSSKNSKRATTSNLSYNTAKQTNTNKSGWFKRNWKWLIGVILLFSGIVGVCDIESSALGVAICMIFVGIGFVVWYIIATAIKRKNEKRAALAAEEELLLNETEECSCAEVDNHVRVCKTCGATTTSPVYCEHCGNLLE